MTARKYETFLSMLDETQLEQWVIAYVNSTFQVDKQARRIGRKGQAQNGVDVHAVLRDIGHVGFQAKAYVTTKLTIAGFDKELALAHKFDPPLKQYTVVTLNPRDVTLQEHARNATLHGENSVEVLALEDLADITAENSHLLKLMFQMVMSADDIQNIMSPFVVDAASLPLKYITVESDGALPAELRTVEAWIDAGMPKTALKALDEFKGAVTQSSRARLKCRALYSLEDYESVVREVEAESVRVDIDATVIAIGAQAAEELENNVLADEWLALALARANEQNKPEAVAAYIRVHARRDEKSIETLESFAISALADASRVANALGDLASIRGDRLRASYWFEIAAKKKPNRALGIEINDAVSKLVLEMDRAGDLANVPAVLTDSLLRLEVLLIRTRNCEVPNYTFVALNALGFAYDALGRRVEAANIWDEALNITRSDPGLWIRRCILSANERVSVPSAELISKHATSPITGLVLAAALIATGRREEALPWIQQVIDDDKVTMDERSIALVENMRLQKASGARDGLQIVEDTLTLLNEMPDSVPLLSWLILHHDHASDEQQTKIRTIVAALEIADLDDARVLALAGALIDKNLADLAVRWLNRIEKLGVDENTTIRNKDAAELTAALYLIALRYADAVKIYEQLRILRPTSVLAVQQQAKALYESGDRKGAFQVLNDAVREGLRSSQLILNWAMLASVLGERRNANRFLKTVSFSSETSPKDYARLLQARAVLGARGHHDEVLAGLRQGLMTPDNVAAVFGVGLRQRIKKNVPVNFGTILHLRIEGAFDGRVCLVDKPALPLPGIQTFDADTHPWISDLLGAHEGDLVDLTRGAFEGKQALVIWVKDATDWVIQEAHDLIGISEPKRTGIHQISGEVHEQLAVTTRHLKARGETVSKAMAQATEFRMPIVFLTERFDASPREFFKSGYGWVPAAHAGTTEAIAIDDAALHSTNAFLFDPITLLLLVAIGGESLLEKLPNKPVITKQAAWQLFDWYLVERENLRIAAHLQLGKKGQLIYTEFSARHRSETLKFWQKINRLIQQNCELIETPPLSDPEEGAQMVRVIGEPIIGGPVAAKHLGRVFISEEVQIRDVATNVLGAKSASLHRLIVYMVEQKLISRTKATLWIAELIRLGWTWIGFPTWMIDHSLRLHDRDKRWSLAEIFLNKLRSADPRTSLQTLVNVLRKADTNSYGDLDLPRLRKLIFIALPRIDRETRASVARSYGVGETSRKHRATQKMLKQWIEE